MCQPVSDRTVEREVQRGRDVALREAAAGHPNAEPRRERKPYLEELYDQAHGTYYENRRRIVEGFLDGYYEEWIRIQEERRQLRLTEAQP